MEDKIILTEIDPVEKNPRFTGTAYSITVTEDVYKFVKEAAKKTGLSRKEIAATLFDFAIQHVEWRKK